MERAATYTGQNGPPVEQISNEGTITYLHHDQQGSTRLPTSSSDVVTGTVTYDTYENDHSSDIQENLGGRTAYYDVKSGVTRHVFICAIWTLV